MILLLAFGNPLRRDDGAGHALAHQLAPLLENALGRPVRAVHAQQLAPEHALEVAAPDVEAVILCDARGAESDQAELLCRRLTVAAQGAGLSHDVSAAELFAYAELVALPGRPLPPAWVATVPGWEFDHGEGLSSGTLRALRETDALARTLANDLHPQLSRGRVA